MSLLKTVALVGRPNVGKSRIFNRLAGRRIAIVHDQAGVTRDVNAVVVDDHYNLLDTGGIGLVVDMDHEKLIAAAEEQVWFAIEAADMICFIVDGREGLTALDEIIAEKLRSSGKPIRLVVNKLDNPELADRAMPFAKLGFGDGVCLSAEHGYGETDLRGAIEEAIGPKPEVDAGSSTRARVRLAIVGRPNVGKSSICNRILNDERLVVSEVPGTTRDSVTLNLDFDSGDGQTLPFALVDTAGLRRSGRLKHSIEYFSGLRSREAIEASDIVFLVIDARNGVTKQDKTIAGEIVETGKCVAVLVNKWDEAVDQYRREPMKGYDSLEAFRKAFAEAVAKELFFLPDSPVIFVSAKTGLAIDRVLKLARRLWEVSGRQLATPKVNQLFARLMAKREPRMLKHRRLKIYYSVQTGNRPFTFRIFCNRATKLEDGYRRYLENGFVREFQLQGCPLRFELRGKTVRYADRGKRGKR